MDKTKVYKRAKWHDVKDMLKKYAGIEPDNVYVKFYMGDVWTGWFVNFTDDVDVERIKRSISGVVVVGKRSIFIGVDCG